MKYLLCGKKDWFVRLLTNITRQSTKYLYKSSSSLSLPRKTRQSRDCYRVQKSELEIKVIQHTTFIHTIHISV